MCRVFSDYVAGKSINQIMKKELIAEGVPTSTGRGNWNKGQVWKILRNRGVTSGEARMVERKTGPTAPVTKARSSTVEREISETRLLPEGTILPLSSTDVVSNGRSCGSTRTRKQCMTPQAKRDTLAARRLH